MTAGRIHGAWMAAVFLMCSVGARDAAAQTGHNGWSEAQQEVIDAALAFSLCLPTSSAPAIPPNTWKPPAPSDPVELMPLYAGGFSHSGGGYTVIQQLLSDVTRRPFETALAPRHFRRASINARPVNPVGVTLASRSAV